MSLKRLEVSHIAVGTELSLGQTLNTNSHTLAQYLHGLGIKSLFHVVVPDNEEQILKSFDFVAPYSDWVFVYGGLGPTSDDISRQMISQWTKVPLDFNDHVWQHIVSILSARNVPIREFQKQQAYFPKNANLMENSKGTAHGFYLDFNNKDLRTTRVFALPGPPKEVQSIGENFLFDFLKKEAAKTDQWVTQIWNTSGIGESELAHRIEPIIEEFKSSQSVSFNHPEFELGYRVHYPHVEIKLSYFKSEEVILKNLLTALSLELSPFLHI